MTERPRPQRWSKGRVRALAWLTSGVTFAASGAVLATAPKPAAADGGRSRARVRPPKVIRRVVIRRVVIVDQPTTAAPTIVYRQAPGASTTTTSGGGGGGTTTSGGS
jgi:hypothetical protein